MKSEVYTNCGPYKSAYFRVNTHAKLIGFNFVYCMLKQREAGIHGDSCRISGTGVPHRKTKCIPPVDLINTYFQGRPMKNTQILIPQRKSPENNSETLPIINGAHSFVNH